MVVFGQIICYIRVPEGMQNKPTPEGGGWKIRRSKKGYNKTRLNSCG